MFQPILLSALLLACGFPSLLEKFDAGRWLIARRFVCVGGKSEPDNWKKAGLKTEKLWMPLAPGVKTQAWLVMAEGKPRGTVILLHGWKNCADVTAGFARHLHDDGFNTLAFDMRGNGKNSSPSCSFGYYEKHDVSSAIDFLSDRKLAGPPYLVLGTSMGAAVGIQAMAGDKRIAAGVFDSSFATLKEMASQQLAQAGFTHTDGILDNAAAITQAPLMAVSPQEEIAKIRNPVFILHGKSDGFIPFENAERLHGSCHAVVNEFLLVDKADHGMVLKDDEPWSASVWKQVIEFINSSIKTQA